MATPGTSSKGSQSIAEWLPLLGSIVQALRGMAEGDPTADHRTAAPIATAAPPRCEETSPEAAER